MDRFMVVEKFVSVNGEGKKAGQLAVFIRLRGCNLRCSYCDTAWACGDDAECTLMTADEIYDYIISTGVKNVTLTGGEPLLAENILTLVKKICDDENLQLEIETNGSISIEQFQSLRNKPSITMDYKLPDSLSESKMLLENFKYLTNFDTVKFVASSVSDLEKALEVIQKFKLVGRVSIYFSSVFGKLEPAQIVDFMMKNRLNDCSLQLQLHKYIWDPNLRGV